MNRSALIPASIVTLAGAAGVVTGNSGGVAPGSTDPNTKFSY